MRNRFSLTHFELFEYTLGSRHEHLLQSTHRHCLDQYDAQFRQRFRSLSILVSSCKFPSLDLFSFLSCKDSKFILAFTNFVLGDVRRLDGTDARRLRYQEHK